MKELNGIIYDLYKCIYDTKIEDDTFSNRYYSYETSLDDGYGYPTHEFDDRLEYYLELHCYYREISRNEPWIEQLYQIHHQYL